MKLPGVYLLDREMDADHNRCVITLVGDREAIQEAAIRGVGKAAELIDLTKAPGRASPAWAQPTWCPFIPIDGLTLEDCVAMAKHVGAEIWRRFEIPVYLYEAAAASPERQNLENIRRGQFEGIRAEIATNPARKPDFGEPRVHPTAGATVVGARKIPRCLQRLSQHARRRDREEDCEGRPRFQWRTPLREGGGLPGAQ